jgi:arylsulfatase
MEAYAGYLSQTDYEIGRLIHYLQEIGQLDNTLIFLMIGDNGASKEGETTGDIGGVPENIYNNAFKVSDSARIAHMLLEREPLGSIETAVNYPMGWALAANTPFQYWKTDANSEGGTRNPLIVFYPRGIKEKGTIRTQYTHISDVLPTTIELTGATVPAVINGYRQDSLEGISFAYSIHHPEAADRHTLQYYELYGSRSLYENGWKAAVYHEKGTPFTSDRWALYNMKADFNERHDSAASYPDKLKSLQALFDQEAIKYHVYPLRGDKSLYDLAKLFGKKNSLVLYNGVSQLNLSSVSSLVFRSFTITADAEIRSAKDEGVLFALGGRFNGLSIFVKDRKVQVAHNINKKLTYLVSGTPLSPGKAIIRYEFNYTFNPKADTAGKEILYINDRKVAEQALLKTEGLVFEYDEGLDVGRDNQSAVSPLYHAPFPFTGKLNKVTIDYR